MWPCRFLQNHKTINFCFKPLSAWYFVIAAVGNKYRHLGLGSVHSTLLGREAACQLEGARWKKSFKQEILTGPPRSARMMPSQDKTLLQHPFSHLQFCPEDRLAWAGSSLTLAPFATSWPLSQDHSGSAVTQYQ